MTECVQQNHGLWRNMHLSGVENTGHIGLALEVTEMGCALPVLVSQFRCQQAAGGL